MEIMVMDFVEAAKVRGEGYRWIIFKEIWPNAAMPLISDFGLRFIYVILFVSSLSFLGLGVQPPLADWGSMVRENLGALQYSEIRNTNFSSSNSYCFSYSCNQSHCR